MIFSSRIGGEDHIARRLLYTHILEFRAEKPVMARHTLFAIMGSKNRQECRDIPAVHLSSPHERFVSDEHSKRSVQRFAIQYPIFPSITKGISWPQHNTDTWGIDKPRSFARKIMIRPRLARQRGNCIWARVLRSLTEMLEVGRLSPI